MRQLAASKDVNTEAEESTVWSRYQAMLSEDIEGYMPAAVKCVTQ
jgi:hypothetical protein